MKKADCIYKNDDCPICKKIEVCDRLDCQKPIKETRIKTELGVFCSEDCRMEIQKNIMKVLLCAF